MPIMIPGMEGGGGGNPFESLLGLVQLLQTMRGMQTNQANALIAHAPEGGAGMTAAQVGLSPKQQKAKFGRVLGDNEPVAPDTPDTLANKQLENYIRNLNPDQVDQMAASLLSAKEGHPEVATTQSRALAGQAATAKAGADVTEQGNRQKVAQALSGPIGDAITELSKASPSVRAGIGAKAAGLPSVGEEENSQLAENIRKMGLKEALAALANPDNPLNTTLKKNLGYNAITAAAGVALGIPNLMDQAANVAFSNKQLANSKNLATFEYLLSQDKDLNQADANWAQEAGKTYGVSPRTILNWKRWKEAGGDPKQMPKGVDSNLDQSLSTGFALARSAVIQDEAQKGNPYAKQAEDLIQAGMKVTDKNTLQAISSLINDYWGKVIVTKTQGPRPADPAGQAQWDAAAKAVSSKFPKLESRALLIGGGSRYVPGATAAPDATANPNPQVGDTVMVNGKQVVRPPNVNDADWNNMKALISAFQTNPAKLTPQPPAP